MNKHIKIIMVQAILLAVVAVVLYLLYPKINVDIDGTLVRFSSINANVVIISENPDFSNPRYLELGERKNMTFDLRPGTYYWKASNNLIEGLEKKFTIESEVGMKIDIKEKGEKEDGNESKLVNIGNAKLNVTKNKEGMMIGYIILEPEESEEIEDNQNTSYTGRQND